VNDDASLEARVAVVEVTLATALTELARARERMHRLESSDAAASAASAALEVNRELLDKRRTERRTGHVQILMGFVAGAGLLWAIVSPFVLGHG
jgi:hypothetical protein